MNNIAYKGFTNKMTTTSGDKGIVYEIGKIYSVDSLRLCEKGYHFCTKLEDVFTYYTFRKQGNLIQEPNRFFEIEVLGVVTDKSGKCYSPLEFYELEKTQGKYCTTSYRIVRELSTEEISKYLADQKVERLKSAIKEIQSLFPMCHIGGSLGLHLQGCTLKRLADRDESCGDFDVIIPYFYIPNDSTTVISKRGSNDFTYSISYKGIKIDVKVDPYQSYKVVNFHGLKVNVSHWEVILAAKLKYAKENDKHWNDIWDLIRDDSTKDTVIEVGDDWKE